jgi:hypothetical protein
MSSIFNDDLSQQLMAISSANTVLADDKLTMKEAFKIILLDESFSNLDVVNIVRIITKKDPINQSGGGGRVAEAWTEVLGLGRKKN